MTPTKAHARARSASLRAGVPLAIGVAAILLMLCGWGCEAIVPGDVEAFRCASSAAWACPPNQVCDTATQQCVPVCTATSCTPPLVCDPTSQQCLPSSMMMMAADSSMPMTDSARPADVVVPVDSAPPPVDSRPVVDSTVDSSCGVGCACTTSNGACKAPLFCVDNTVLPGTADTAFCSMACCSSSDCPDGSVCYASGTPGNFCVSTQVLQIAATGAGLGGATCGAGSDCRSGTCDSGGHCLDTCCTDTSCATGAFCSLDETTPASLHQAFYCLAESPPGAPPGGSCSVPSDCSSNACLCGPDDCVVVNGTCTMVCCGVASCGGGGNACFVNKTNMTDSVIACSTSTGTDAFGAGCSQDDKCASQVCDTTAGKCSDFCCVDSDCASFGDYVCRPRSAAPHYLICVRGS